MALRVSVGLMVLAPSPLAWEVPGKTDIRFEVDDGVVAGIPVPLGLPGDFVARDDNLL